ncbi:TrkH family potassium uptake protein [Methanofollis formosanus]|uniref:TrkH family potassium uptake protein n=1 Tax=Methanofollis formosanus TaxID=299308 RepID=A0A8G1EFV7_9EURY|nr:TrkH family potassium uptake protein [Methanofollis formosanus]QYZ78511.1 TrkH family potassium uptake protein [Methanofollis formosanus]
MDRTEYISAIAPDIGRILRFIGVVTCLPLIVALIYQEWEMLLPMGLVPIIYVVFGTLLMQVPRPAREAKLSAALAAVALIWLLSAVIGSVPFIVGLGMPITDSIFEAMSGWTDTGMTLLPDVDATPRTLLFWRSFMQWLGGIGIVAFTIALASRSGLVQRGLYRSEGRTEAFMPSVVATGFAMWRIYIIITLLSIGLVLLSGVTLWDATNLAMTAIATGGFTVHSEGIPFYQNATLEFLLVPVMIAGAMPFKLYYLMYHNRKFGFFGDRQAIALLALTGVGFLVVALDLVYLTGAETMDAIRQGLFMATAGITSTGFQNTSPYTWPSVTVLFLVIFMLIGGSSGSTAGGMKISRVILGLESLVWWFKRIFVSGKVVVPFRHGGKTVQKNIAEVEVSKNMLIIILYFLTVFICTIVVFHLEHGAPFESSHVIFEIVSAFCNNGISTGFVTPDMSLGSKWLFIFLMWFGRLELVPILVLFVGLAKGFE